MRSGILALEEDKKRLENRLSIADKKVANLEEQLSATEKEVTALNEGHTSVVKGSESQGQSALVGSEAAFALIRSQTAQASQIALTRVYNTETCLNDSFR